MLTLPVQPASAQSSAIAITGDAQLATRGYPGAGTAANPYVIAGLEITPSGAPGISIQNTRLYVTIRDVTIVGGGRTVDAIKLTNAENITIERADLQFNRAGVSLVQSNRTTIRDSTIRASEFGIELVGTGRSTFERNNLSVNTQDVALKSNAPNRTSTLNVFRSNNLSIATGQFGFHFQSVANYDNDIDQSNVVNFLPVRWHTHVLGTPTVPVSIKNEDAYVKGMTNIGQVVCYDCSFVRLEAINASSGIASGLVLERARNVTVLATYAEGNDASGIAIFNSSNVTIDAPATYANSIGAYASNVTNLTIRNANIAANGVGISVVVANDTRLESNRVEGNTKDGITLDRTNRTITELNSIRSNAGDGIRVTEGTRNILRNETIVASGGAGVNLVKTLNTTVTTSRIENNTKGGIVFGSTTLLSKALSNTLVGNKEGGIWLSSSGAANRIEGNALSLQAKHIRITKSEGNIFERNNMTAGGGQTGFWFDDEPSYLNEVSTSNTVGDTPLQWHVALVGSPNSQIILRGIRSEAANVTNIAQVMVYKSSYLRLEDTVADQGLRGIFVLQSSSITVNDAELHNNTVGVEFSGTQTGDIRRVVAAGSTTGVLLRDTLNVSVSDVSAPDSKVAVEFTGTRSRGSVVERINATGTKDASVRDPTAASKEPRHLIADAGLDKLVGAGRNATFADATGVARFGSERILRQSWDFGDGETEESLETATLRPLHHYAEPGNYTATYTVETADGLVLTDTTRVRVVPPPDVPVEPIAIPDAERGRVALNWTIPQSEFPITKYSVYRGLDPQNLTFLLDSVNNATTIQEKFEKSMKVYYAISATAFGGESALSEPIEMRIRPPPPPEEEEKPTPTPTVEEKGSPLPGLPLVVGVVALAALILRRRK